MKMVFCRSKIFDFPLKFQCNISMKHFEIFDLKNFRRQISKFSNYGSNKPFRSKFCAELCRIRRRRPWNQNPSEVRAWEASAKKNLASAKKSTFRNVCPQGDVLRISLRRAYHIPRVSLGIAGVIWVPISISYHCQSPVSTQNVVRYRAIRQYPGATWALNRWQNDIVSLAKRGKRFVLLDSQM